MGNSSYNLHKACPELDARYKHCQALYFENSLIIPPGADPVTGVVAPRIVYRDSIPVTDPADIALTNDVLDRNSMNFACRDMWEDYKECVMDVMKEKQADYLRRKEAKKAAAVAAAAPPATAAAATPAPVTAAPSATAAPKQ